jgi:hypothetical protein
MVHEGHGFDMSDIQYQTVYNSLSFALATTMYMWMRAEALADKYRSAVVISGLVTFNAAYHYVRTFNSWVGAYEYKPKEMDPVRTGVPSATPTIT